MAVFPFREKSPSKLGWAGAVVLLWEKCPAELTGLSTIVSVDVDSFLFEIELWGFLEENVCVE